MSDSKPDTHNESAQFQKEAYSTPTLMVYGTAKDITLAVSGAVTDGLVGSIVVSDRTIKEHFQPVDAQEILSRLAALPIETWNYQADDPSVRHIGAMAQDFAALFGVGDSDKQIHSVDAAGVAFVAIQALYELLQAKESEIDALKADVAELKQQMLASRFQ